MRVCPHCGSDDLSYCWGDYLCMACGKTSSKKDCEKAGTVKAIELCFKEMVDARRSKFHWVSMKELFQCVKKKVEKLRKLSIKEFHEVIRSLWNTPSWEERRVDLSRGSIARPYVSRYGIHTKDGCYYYVHLREKRE